MAGNQKERRRFERYEKACPIRIFDGFGRTLAETETVNISCGGAFLIVPAHCAPKPQSTVEFGLSAPGDGGKTQDFSGRATVVRRQAGNGDDHVGVALEFASPLPLQLEG